MTDRRTMTLTEWRTEGARLFGPEEFKWRFVCPACGHVASREDYHKAGAPDGAVAYSCVGRWIPGSRDAFSEGPGPCDYAGGGLFRQNPLTVVDEHGGMLTVFDFDGSPTVATIDERWGEAQTAVEHMHRWNVRFRRKSERKAYPAWRDGLSDVHANTASQAIAMVAKRIRSDYPGVDYSWLCRSLRAVLRRAPKGELIRTGGQRMPPPKGR
jgi:hypothetical protein